MMRRLAPLSTVALWLGLFACREPGPRVLRDSEGRSFEAACSAAGACKFRQTSGPKRTRLPAQSLLLGGRLVGICDVAADDGGAPAGPFDCRPLRCSSDADCPPLHGSKDGQCLNERCSDAAEAIGTSDAIMLCLAGTGLGRETPAQVERYALGLNCGSPCTIPAPCQQL